MKILDLRPPWVRLFSGPRPPRSRSVTRPLERLVEWGVRRRVAGRPTAPERPFIISVGNLALGGTGKTPVVMDLAASLAARGWTGAVLTRGYGSPLAGPLEVDPTCEGAGDEARLMARRLSGLGWPVIQSHDRRAGWEFLKSQHPDLRIVLLEDAHQSRGLPRHLDLVIVDAWEAENVGGETLLRPRTGPVFPLGPWRESAAGARRAAALLVEGGPDVPLRSVHGQPVFAYSRRQSRRLVRGQVAEVESARRWGLISGIARPEGFEKSAAEILGCSIALSIRCRDHEPYSPDLVRRIGRSLDDAGVQAVATTGKDWVKLEGVWTDPRPVVNLDLHLDWLKKDALGLWLAERAGLSVFPDDQSGSTAP